MTNQVVRVKRPSLGDRREANTYPPNGLLCSECGQPQYDTPYGAVCMNGHGGAPGVEPRAQRPEEPPRVSPRVEVRSGEERRVLAPGFTARDGDVLVVSYPEVTLPLPRKYATMKLGGFIYTRKLAEGDDVGEQARLVLEWLTSLAEVEGAKRYRRMASQFTSSGEGER